MIGRWRNATQLGAFLFLAVVPVLNAYVAWYGIQGWYQGMAVAGIAFVSPLEGVETLIASRALYVPLLVGLVPGVVIALVLGRVFCSWVCPVNALQELSDRLTRMVTRGRPRAERVRWPRSVLWWVLAADMTVVVALGVPFFAAWSPPGLVGRELMTAVFFHTLAWEGVILVAVLLLNALTPRLFCRTLCPLGGLLALLGAPRKLRVRFAATKCTACGACDSTCPLGLAPSAGESRGVHCWNCAKCADFCHDGALGFGFRESGDRA